MSLLVNDKNDKAKQFEPYTLHSQQNPILTSYENWIISFKFTHWKHILKYKKIIIMIMNSIDTAGSSSFIFLNVCVFMGLYHWKS